MTGKVLVRTYSAGVHFGTLVGRKGKEVELRNARRVWFWKGAYTLHELSLTGPQAGSKISESVKSIVLTEAIEVLPVTPIAAKAMESVGWAKN